MGGRESDGDIHTDSVKERETDRNTDIELERGRQIESARD